MNLPFAHLAAVEASKVRDYLLSHEHPVGRFKAMVFEQVGYRRRSWQVLRGDLVELAARGTTSLKATTLYGQKWEVCGILRGPNGKYLPLVTVWLVGREKAFPRLITAYPWGRR